MANVSVHIAAVVADTGAAATQSVTVNVQVAVAAAPTVTPDGPSYEPQPPQEPDDNAGPDVVGDADVAAHVAGQPVDPDDASSSGQPSLVSTSPASTPRAGPHGDTTAAAFWSTGDGAVIHGATRLAALRSVAAAEPPPQPQPHAPPQPEDLEAQDEDAEPQLHTQAQAQATVGAATASAAGAVASAAAAAAAGTDTVAGTSAGPAAGTVAGAGASAAAAAAAGADTVAGTAACPAAGPVAGAAAGPAAGPVAGAGAAAAARTWCLNRNNVEVWYDDNVRRWRDRRGRFAKGPR